MSDSDAAEPTAHQDEESETPVAGAQAQHSPDVDVLPADAPRLSGKRAAESEALMSGDEPLRGD